MGPEPSVAKSNDLFRQPRRTKVWYFSELIILLEKAYDRRR
jgi:hypothetical protein